MPVDVTALTFKVDWNATSLEPLAMSWEVAFKFSAAGAVWSLEVCITDALHARVIFHDHNLTFHESFAVVLACHAVWFSSSEAFEGFGAAAVVVKQGHTFRIWPFLEAVCDGAVYGRIGTTVALVAWIGRLDG